MGSPVRTCRACGSRKAKDALHRYVWYQGGPRIDTKQKMNGRGVYCCKLEKCVERFAKMNKKWKIFFRL